MEELRNIYEGDKKIQQFKLQNLKNRFQNSRMFENETIDSYMHRVIEVVIGIKGVGKEMKYDEVVRKVLQTLPKYFILKVLAIE